jgi:hypothetical protein
MELAERNSGRFRWELNRNEILQFSLTLGAGVPVTQQWFATIFSCPAAQVLTVLFWHASRFLASCIKIARVDFTRGQYTM